MNTIEEHEDRQTDDCTSDAHGANSGRWDGRY